LRLASRRFWPATASARSVFRRSLPIATVDVDLGQHELVDDVLVSTFRHALRRASRACTTTPLGDRAGAVFKAIEDVKGVGSLLNPIKERNSRLPWVALDPRFDSLRVDARFEDLLRRMNLHP
jgi:hypothetical protein